MSLLVWNHLTGVSIILSPLKSFFKKWFTKKHSTSTQKRKIENPKNFGISRSEPRKNSGKKTRVKTTGQKKLEEIKFNKNSDKKQFS